MSSKMAAFTEEYRPHSSSGSDTAVSEAYSSDTYVSDSEKSEDKTKQKVCKNQSVHGFPYRQSNTKLTIILGTKASRR
jgi:hypothetical protein